MQHRTRQLAAALAAVVLIAGCGGGGDDDTGSQTAPVILATTTSTQDSGLLDVLVPAFEKESGAKVKTVAVGSGQAIEMGARGEADVVLVHSPAAEEKMVADGKGRNRRVVMHNDFVIVGPASDPAHIRGASATAAMARIARAKAPFISRGDDSGTNTFELKLWDKAGVKPKGTWYQESGQGMGATLQIAADKDALHDQRPRDVSRHRERARPEAARRGRLSAAQRVPRDRDPEDRTAPRQHEGGDAFALWIVRRPGAEGDREYGVGQLRRAAVLHPTPARRGRAGRGAA